MITACPDNDWRLIFALARFGGVRFPSEVESLKWSDVDWENSTFTVHEKKVEHHPGRGRRVVPIFTALRPHLERAFRERAPVAVPVVPEKKAPELGSMGAVARTGRGPEACWALAWSAAKAAPAIKRVFVRLGLVFMGRGRGFSGRHSQRHGGIVTIS